SKEKLISLIPFKMIDPQTAADIILTSVVHNKAFIVFPFYARLAWWLSRICPSLVEIFHRKTIEKFRAYKASRLHFSKSKKD
ncbi:MAG: hypothetical protein JNN15_16040, partial [Blastocatellia bacterium]|nr:hypothetical protein [Blastocatellia bacterium]